MKDNNKRTSAENPLSRDGKVDLALAFPKQMYDLIQTDSSITIWLDDLERWLEYHGYVKLYDELAAVMEIPERATLMYDGIVYGGVTFEQFADSLMSDFVDGHRVHLADDYEDWYGPYEKHRDDH